MSDTEQPAEPAAPVSVTIELPSGLIAAYDALVEARIYPSRENALLHGLVESWRYNKGAFHRIRLDLDCWKDEPDGESERAPRTAEGEDAPES